MWGHPGLRKQILGQPGLHKKILSQKQEQTLKQNNQRGLMEYKPTLEISRHILANGHSTTTSWVA